MTKTELPSIDTLRNLWDYNPHTGTLTWLKRPASMFKREGDCAAWNARYAGKPAFTTGHNKGYRTGAIFGRRYYAHRVAYAIYHGEWPDDQIDHINGKRSDNRISNLRAVTRQENGRNQKRYSTNTSGVTGVYWFKQTQKWVAQIIVNGKNIHLGYFDCFLAASMVRLKAEADFGFHPLHGRVVRSA